jgi:hypothetical protein
MKVRKGHPRRQGPRQRDRWIALSRLIELAATSSSFYPLLMVGGRV